MGELLIAKRDPMGAAIADYHYGRKVAKLRVLSPDFDEDEMPVDYLFRSFDEMPPLEQMALREASGRILDVGAASGCHSLALQEMGKDVVAVDISPLSVDVMRDRGVVDARLVDFFDDDFTEQFDTILMLMNGTTIVGTVDRMPEFFEKLRHILRPGGKVLVDSSDLCYLFEDEDGSMEVNLNGDYYGEITYEMRYKGIHGNKFKALYLDFDTLSLCAEQSGFTATKLANGDHYDYLASLQLAE